MAAGAVAARLHGAYTPSMGEPARKLLSYRDYLDLEVANGVRHEFLDGEVVAMAGGSVAHADLALNVALLLKAGLRGPCRASNSDQRLREPVTGFATYPDVSVVCGPRTFHPEDRQAITNPALIVEVLSPSTEANDRGAKFERYGRFSTLAAYVLVNTSTRRLEVFTRNADQSWTLRTYGPAERAPLLCVGLELAVDDVYADVELDPLPSPLRPAGP